MASRRRLVLPAGFLVSVVAVGLPGSARAVLPYPDYDVYQGRQYEREGTACLFTLGVEPLCAQLLENAILFDPTRVDAHQALGWYYVHAGDRTRALASFSTVLRLAPDRTRLLLTMGDLYALEGRSSLAQEKYDQLLALAPGDPQLLFSLASLEALRGNVPGAAERLSQALAAGLQPGEQVALDPRWQRHRDHPAIRAVLERSGEK